MHTITSCAVPILDCHSIGNNSAFAKQSPGQYTAKFSLQNSQIYLKLFTLKKSNQKTKEKARKCIRCCLAAGQYQEITPVILNFLDLRDPLENASP